MRARILVNRNLINGSIDEAKKSSIYISITFSSFLWLGSKILSSSHIPVIAWFSKCLEYLGSWLRKMHRIRLIWQPLKAGNCVKFFENEEKLISWAHQVLFLAAKAITQTTSLLLDNYNGNSAPSIAMEKMCLSGFRCYLTCPKDSERSGLPNEVVTSETIEKSMIRFWPIGDWPYVRSWSNRNVTWISGQLTKIDHKHN